MKGFCCATCGTNSNGGHGSTDGTTNGNGAKVKVEAESGTLSGGAVVETSTAGFSGRGYVGGLTNSGDAVTVTVEVTAGLYELVIRYTSPGPKHNHLYVNDKYSQSIEFSTASSWQNLVAGTIYLHAGRNSIKIEKDWGFVNIDYFTLQSRKPHRGTVAAALTTPSPIGNAQKLYNYLRSVYRKQIISGQTLSAPANGVVVELETIQKNTGQQPALAGFDFQNYSPVSNMQDDGTVSRIIDWYNNKNGIPQVQWHWCSPTGAKQEWWRAFYTEHTNFDVTKAVTPGTEEHRLVVRDLDAIAAKLKILQDEGVPLLWRPLHEAEGGWFWWGAKGPKPLQALYRMMYDRFVRHHSLRNLIWVWVSGTSHDSLEWYPGDQSVDIISADVYAPAGNHGALTSTYYQLHDMVKGNKIVALAENGPVPNPADMLQEKATWSWWMTWSGYFVNDKTDLFRCSQTILQ
eukprot:TRINITY_DN2672_c0_g1_i4.p1 TRINITY_DN2672_c0_g1~~TRINITY_DN2672_c0_g1_i4.p1  ORF type:complete len:460 (+),score=89.32 TRINITY_DN2672_c0_g1_i4:596-1975(+)